MKQTAYYNVHFPQEPVRPGKKPEFQKGKPMRMTDPHSLWGSHDPAIYRDPDSGMYYVYNTNAIARKSADLIHWETIGKVVEDPPKESLEWTKSHAIWAPDIIKVGDTYRLYCSNSSWGVRQSAIFLATSKSPEGPFEPQGCVLKTKEETGSPVNAIDANPVEDAKTGEQYMVYGSFWGGCHILKLNKETGYAAEEGIGTCIARRPKWTDSAIEGPYIHYNRETGYYYLFVSYGSLNRDYNIRVGRSKVITGPYVDYNGRAMTDLQDEDNTVGYLLACGYEFNGGQGYMAPGHNSVLQDADGRWYLVCHIRQHNFSGPEPATMHIYQMFWTKDGWPILNPMCYAGETLQSFVRKEVPGFYERIVLQPAVPQGVYHSTPLVLYLGGKAEAASLMGRWKLSGENHLTITFGPVTEEYIMVPAWDWDKWEPTIAITGKNNRGICVWGKKNDPPAKLRP